MIAIDYVPGSHGHFLSFVCNRFLTDIPRHLMGDTPLSSGLGTSHDTVSTYWAHRYFREAHYFLNQGAVTAPPEQGPSLRHWHGKVIQIWFNTSDLLTLTATCFLRAGDFGIDLDDLEHDTWNKLQGPYYRTVLTELERLSRHNLEQSVRDVRDPTWPTVRDWQDWDRLPQAIRDECLDQHGLVLWRLDAEHTDCPRWALREHFRHSFLDGADNGFLRLRDSMRYRDECDVWQWQFDDFFDTDRFMRALQALGAWSGSVLRDPDQARELHTHFLRQHQFRHLRPRCQHLVDLWTRGQNHTLRHLSLVEQAWLEAKIQQQTGRNLHRDSVEFWHDLDEIRSFLS